MTDTPTVPAVVTLSDASVDAIARRVIELQGTAPAAAASLPRMMTSDEVMQVLGYSRKGSFMAAARAANVPMARINARKFAFAPADVAAWLERAKAQRHAVTVTTVAAERRRVRAAA
ncbi:MAG: hypothetical protein IPL39_16140 [Opitutaceae bacterium]|nr:hypothetical protein [Opitutaceae bacterium]